MSCTMGTCGRGLESGVPQPVTVACPRKLATHARKPLSTKALATLQREQAQHSKLCSKSWHGSL